MNNAICPFHVLLVYSFCRCVLSVLVLQFSIYQYVVMHLIFVLFIVSLGLWEVPEYVRFAFHDIVFSSFPGLSENDIRAISFELMKVIPVDAEPDVNFYAHIVTDDKMDSETLVLFSPFSL